MPRVRAFASLVLVTSALRPANTLAQQPAPPVRDTRAEARAMETATMSRPVSRPTCIRPR